ncbi:MAG: hypothetical protein LBV51_01440, partial [Acholeplasmatales bacterium]|nr:hypothetical protein [Acholeplasmatales bacterium]
YFSEYLLLDYYTTDGLYKVHLSDSFSKKYCFTTNGVRVYHIDARTTTSLNPSDVFLYNNTSSAHKLISFVNMSATSLDNVDSIKNSNSKINNSMLLKTTTTFNWNLFSWYQASIPASSTVKSITIDEITSEYVIINIDL